MNMFHNLRFCWFYGLGIRRLLVCIDDTKGIDWKAKFDFICQSSILPKNRKLVYVKMSIQQSNDFVKHGPVMDDSPYWRYLSRCMKKKKKMTCAQRRLRSAWAYAQSDQSSLSAWRNLGSLATHKAHSGDWSDWTNVQADLNLRNCNFENCIHVI